MSPVLSHKVPSMGFLDLGFAHRYQNVTEHPHRFPPSQGIQKWKTRNSIFYFNILSTSTESEGEGIWNVSLRLFWKFEMEIVHATAMIINFYIEMILGWTLVPSLIHSRFFSVPLHHVVEATWAGKCSDGAWIADPPVTTLKCTFCQTIPWDNWISFIELWWNLISNQPQSM